MKRSKKTDTIPYDVTANNQTSMKRRRKGPASKASTRKSPSNDTAKFVAQASKALARATAALGKIKA